MLFPTHQCQECFHNIRESCTGLVTFLIQRQQFLNHNISENFSGICWSWEKGSSLDSFNFGFTFLLRNETKCIPKMYYMVEIL